MLRDHRFTKLITAAIITAVMYGAATLPEVARPVVPSRDAGQNSSFSLITEPAAGTKPLIEHIRSATISIDLVMYQFKDQEVAAALSAAEQRGIRVRVLLNHGYRGQAGPDNEPMYTYLRQNGVVVKWTPGYFDLTHEKSILIDKRELIVMTLNLTPNYYDSGREFAIIDTDATDITAANQAFNDDWQGIRRPASIGHHLIWSPGAKAGTLELIRSARASLEVYNEEMADGEVTEALKVAAQRGVKVRICMTYASYWKEPFNELITSGVRVHTYAAKADRYIHAKMIIADGNRAFVGSQNFSEPSLNNNRELGLVLTDREVLTGLEAAFSEDWEASRPFGNSS